MAFSAVYLDHHWVLDAVAGIVYCTTVVTVARVLERRSRIEATAAATVAVAESSAPAWSVLSACHEPALRRAAGAPVRLGHRHLVRLRNASPRRPARWGRSARFRSTCSSPAGDGPASAVAALAVTAIGIWAASVVARDLGKKDPQIVVVDEVAGMLVTMLPMAHVSWRAILCGFVLFRLFDITKPWPVRRFEALPGGWGIVMDDVVAGGFGACVMVGLRAAGALP